ncbi:MAG: glycosyltransferase, partial [Cyanobacteriota bacterium]|nr:glycosyltransferase [Cyanobacteriota bacterium]
PVLHSFRLPVGLDYIKLPCLGRDRAGKMAAKYLRTDVDEAVKLRSDIIKMAAVSFQPDLFLIDKKPYGLLGELKETLDHLKTEEPHTKFVLLLRDILDSPEATMQDWQKNDYHRAIASFYDRILVVGMPKIFDVAREYQFPEDVAEKVRYCGYIRREPGRKSRQQMRQVLQIQPDEKLVLVTPGGGGDGEDIIKAYLQGFAQHHPGHKIKSSIICGPEMFPSQREELQKIARQSPQVEFCEFTDDLASYMDASDAVVSMGGYNTICELLSYSKRAVIIPRTHPVQEQWIRAERMEKFGLFKAIHPDRLTPQNLMNAVREQLSYEKNHLPPVSRLDLNALFRVEKEICELLWGGAECSLYFAKMTHRFDFIPTN